MRRSVHIQKSEKNGILRMLLMSQGLEYTSQDKFADALTNLSKEMMRVYPQNLYNRKSTARVSPSPPPKSEFGKREKTLQRRQVDWGYLSIEERKRILITNRCIPDINTNNGKVYDNTVTQLELLPTNEMLWIPPELSNKLEMTRSDLFQIFAVDDKENPRYNQSF